MLFGEKFNQVAKRFGSKSQQGKSIGQKLSKYVLKSNVPQSNYHSAHIPETKVISHDNNGFNMSHRYKDSTNSVHNINRGSIGDKMSLERHRRQHKDDYSSQFH